MWNHSRILKPKKLLALYTIKVYILFIHSDIFKKGALSNDGQCYVLHTGQLQLSETFSSSGKEMKSCTLPSCDVGDLLTVEALENILVEDQAGNQVSNTSNDYENLHMKNVTHMYTVKLLCNHKCLLSLFCCWKARYFAAIKYCFFFLNLNADA